MGTPSCFYTIFKNRNNFCDFLFVSLDKEAFPKWDRLLKEFAQKGVNSFL